MTFLLLYEVDTQKVCVFARAEGDVACYKAWQQHTQYMPTHRIGKKAVEIQRVVVRDLQKRPRQ